MKTLPLILTLILVSFGQIKGQTIIEIEKLFHKKWEIEKFEIGEHKSQNDGSFKDIYMIFNPNNTGKGKDKGSKHRFNWEYNSENQSLTTLSKKSNERSTMKILSISESEFIWESTNTEGLLMKVTMTAK
jgi:hypothetical protein